LAFIPAGQFEFHIHASRAGGNFTVYAEIWETDSAGVDIALIGTTEHSTNTTTSEAEYRLFFVTINTYTLASTASRIVCRIWAITTSSATCNLYVGDTADSHLTLPTNTVDASNFIPYIGATANINTGAFTVTSAGFSGPLTGNVIGNCSGSSGSCTGSSASCTGNSATVTGFSPTGGKTLTLTDSTTLGNASISLANGKALTLTGNLTASSDATVSGTNTGDQTSVSGSSGSCTGNAAGLSGQYIDWNASSGGTSIANKPSIPSAASNILLQQNFGGF